MTIDSLAPSRRRHNARLIAAATDLIGKCAQVAAVVYRPIAYAPPGAGGVPMDPRALTDLRRVMGERLAQARQEDIQRCPRAVRQEDVAGWRAAARRLAVAEVEDGLQEDVQTDASTLVRLMTPAQVASLGRGGDFLEAVEADPNSALDLLEEMTRDGEYTAAEILDEALDAALAAAQLTVSRAVEIVDRDPSAVGEMLLSAVRTLAIAVRLA